MDHIICILYMLRLYVPYNSLMYDSYSMIHTVWKLKSTHIEKAYLNSKKFSWKPNIHKIEFISFDYEMAKTGTGLV